MSEISDNMISNDQLESWLKGMSIHNDSTDECCPDFSCCEPSLLASKEDRQLFYNAWHNGQRDIVNRMLMGFLGKSLQNMNRKNLHSGYTAVTGVIACQK